MFTSTHRTGTKIRMDSAVGTFSDFQLTPYTNTYTPVVPRSIAVTPDPEGYFLVPLLADDPENARLNYGLIGTRGADMFGVNVHILGRLNGRIDATSTSSGFIDYYVDDGIYRRTGTIEILPVTGTPINQPPQLISATASPATVTGTTSALSAAATDPDGDDTALTYAWTISSSTAPAGRQPVFSDPSAANPTITFAAVGTYVATVTITDLAGDSLSTDIPLTVVATPTTIVINN